jgi:transposase
VSSRPSYEQLAVLVVEQAQTIRRLETEVSELRGEVADLKRRLAQNSRNSSRPPSSDGLAKPPVPKSLRRPSGREPGGQPGHGGGYLEMVAVPDRVVVHAPVCCEDCGAGLVGSSAWKVERRQVFDLPEIRLSITEHHAEQRRCVGCGHLTVAEFPAGVSAPTQYGPRVRALGLYLIAGQHLPYLRTARLLSDWLHAPLSTGTLAGFVKDAADELGGFLDLVHAGLIDSPLVHFDETGARVQGRTRWLHCASTEILTFYALHDRRGTEGIDHCGVMPNYNGIAVHDGWPQYRKYTQATHALCNAHHLRELLAVIEPNAERQSWAIQADRLLRRLQDRVRDAKTAGLQSLPPRTLAGYRAAWARIITLGHRQNPPPTKRTKERGPIGRTPAANLLRRLDEHREDVLRFAHDFTVPFDNNLVERDIRMIKIQQKISGSWRTSTGADRFLAIRAYISTARKQGQGLLGALTSLAEHDPWIPAVT